MYDTNTDQSLFYVGIKKSSLAFFAFFIPVEGISIEMSAIVAFNPPPPSIPTPPVFFQRVHFLVLIQTQFFSLEGLVRFSISTESAKNFVLPEMHPRNSQDIYVKNKIKINITNITQL